MSAPSPFRVRFVEYTIYEIGVDDAADAKEAVTKAQAIWDDDPDAVYLCDSGTDDWEARPWA